MLFRTLISVLIALFGVIAFKDYYPAMIVVVIFLAFARFCSLRYAGGEGFMRQAIALYLETGVYVFVCARQEIRLGAYDRLPAEPELFSIGAHLALAVILMMTCFFGMNKIEVLPSLS